MLWRHILGFTFPCFSLLLPSSIIPHIPFGLPDVNCVAKVFVTHFLSARSLPLSSQPNLHLLLCKDMKTKTAGNIESRRCLCTTSVFTSTQNVGINASCCISLFCIYVLYCIFPAFCKISAIRYNALSDRAFPHGCYRMFVESKDCGFLGISLVSLCFLCEKI